MNCRVFLVGLPVLLLWAILRAQGADPLASIKFDPATIVGTQGFFRVGQSTAGRWWFIDPDGKPFFYRGVTSINRAGLKGGRRAVEGPYAGTVDRKYAYRTSPDAFVQSVFRRLGQWKFNALGAWATEEFFDKGLPYTEILEFARVEPSIRIQGLMWLPDVYDPAWTKAADQWAARICAPRRNSKLLVGYFTDNEMGWAQVNEEDIAAQGDPTKPLVSVRPSLLQICLGLEPSRAAHQAARDLALKKHNNNLAAALRDWGVRGTDLGAVKRMTDAGQAITSKAYLADQIEFSRDFARRYFQQTAQAIRRHDPNHLVLGCRFGGPPGPVVLEECKRPWVDVISANNYRENFRERMDIYHRPNKMPVLNGEFAWYSGTFVSQGRPDVPRMLQRGQASLEKAIAHPALVGYTWYRWVSHEHAPGKIGDGLVNTDDTDEVHVKTLTQINARADAIAAGAR